MRQTICGVYKILCIKNNKFYIGSSSDITNRWWDHKARLNSKTHANPYLQNAWNKYGEKSFLFDIVETCKEEVQYQREQFWINETRCFDNNIGFNVNKDVEKGPDKSKEYIITKPDGTEIEIKNLNKFCRENGLSPSGLGHVANGFASQYKGWLCRFAGLTREQWESTRRNGKYGGGWKGNWEINCPDGRVEIVESLTDFCKQNGLSQGNMTEVSNGKRKQHRGYSCKRT
jgi:hypothetical protein